MEVVATTSRTGKRVASLFGDCLSDSWESDTEEVVATTSRTDNYRADVLASGFGDGPNLSDSSSGSDTMKAAASLSYADVLGSGLSPTVSNDDTGGGAESADSVIVISDSDDCHSLAMSEDEDTSAPSSTEDWSSVSDGELPVCDSFPKIKMAVRDKDGHVKHFRNGEPAYTLERLWSQQITGYRPIPCTGCVPPGYKPATAAHPDGGKCTPTSQESEFVDELLGESVRFFTRLTNRNIRAKLTWDERQTWKPVTIEEMYAFLGSHIVMAVNRQPEIGAYFQRSSIVGSPAIQEAFTRRRFGQLNANFGCTMQTTVVRPVNETDQQKECYMKDGERNDPIMKIRPLLEYINSRFRAVRNPGRALCVDETMTYFKGRSFIKVRQPKKPIPCGFEHFTLSDAGTGYVLNDEAHIGRNVKLLFHQDEEPKPAFPGNFMGRVTRYVARHYLGKGYHLAFDNRFTSAELLEFLFTHHRTTAVGSLRGNVAEMPAVFKTLYNSKVASGERGTATILQSGRLVLTAWKDTRTVCILSTGVNPKNSGTVASRRVGAGRVELACPAQVVDYQRNYKGVDLANQLAAKCRVGRRSIRWHRYFFWHKFNQILVNAYINWKERTNTRKPRAQWVFRAAVATQFLNRLTAKRQIPRLVIDFRVHKCEKANRTRRCVICLRNKLRHESIRWCNVCKVHLCNPIKRPECLDTHRREAARFVAERHLV